MDLGALKKNCQLQVEWSGIGDILGNDCMHVSKNIRISRCKVL